jgi:cytochrome c-type biogenesis protein
MDISNITLGLAFLAGLASFLSPCVFSLVPAYIGYLGGRTVGSGDDRFSKRWLTFSHGLAFVLGFSVVFITLGVATSALGNVLFALRPWIARIGGLVVIVFGVHMTGIIRIPFLEYDTRHQEAPDAKLGYLSSALMGVFFSAGWSPCVGPVLGAILTLSFSGGSILQGASLLTAYSAGLAVPFLIAALGIGWVSTTIRRYGRVMRIVEIVMGVILIIVGIMLTTGTLENLSRFGFFINFGL